MENETQCVDIDECEQPTDHSHTEENQPEKKYAVVFFVKYRYQRPPEEEMSGYFGQYGDIDHIDYPENKNFAFIFMSSLSIQAEFKRTRATIRQILEDMDQAQPFFITVARNNTRQQNNQGYNYSYPRYGGRNNNMGNSRNYDRGYDRGYDRNYDRGYDMNYNRYNNRSYRNQNYGQNYNQRTHEGDRYVRNNFHQMRAPMMNDERQDYRNHQQYPPLNTARVPREDFVKGDGFVKDDGTVRSGGFMRRDAFPRTNRDNFARSHTQRQDTIRPPSQRQGEHGHRTQQIRREAS